MYNFHLDKHYSLKGTLPVQNPDTVLRHFHASQNL